MASLRPSRYPSLSATVDRIYNDPDLHKFYFVTITASELQDLLTAGRVTSITIEQISNHNDYLRAILVTCPTSLWRSKPPDADRSEERAWEPLHELPVPIEVCTISAELFYES
jgi:hypothetical protein